MCGLAGVLSFEGEPAALPLLERMGALLRHRGPDDQGVVADGPLGLVHRRLSILDLSPAGRQPMQTESGSHVLVYNGEVYNYRELKKELEGQGERFLSNTDSEVVLRGMALRGTDFLLRMRGMFAFALWDARQREVLLVRDRLGIKPLYYWLSDHWLVFASEIKPILEALGTIGIPVGLDPQALDPYFTLRYVPGDTTLFQGIRKLEPGTWLKVSCAGRTSAARYWSLIDQSSLLGCREREAQDRYLELLESSVGECMVSDVPVGAFLSGGIDSAAVVALMRSPSASARSAFPEGIETFTFGMGADVDETSAASALAQALGVRNSSTALGPDDYQLYERAIWHLEEPLGDSIIVPTYLLAAFASRSVKVVQLGEGADEILGGYVHQLTLRFTEALRRSAPPGLMHMLGRGMDFLPQALWDRLFPYPGKLGRSGTARLLGFLRERRGFGESYSSLTGIFSEEERRELLGGGRDCGSSPRTAARVLEEFYQQMRNPDPLNRLLAVDLRYWTTDYGMLRLDKLTMAHSLEARVPYLDHRLVEFCLALPGRTRMRAMRQKILMREALRRRALLPAQVTRRPKRAFHLPAERCFGPGFEDYVRDVLSDSALARRGILSAGLVRRLRDARNRELLQSKQLMALLCFEIWASLYLDGKWRERR